MANVHIYILIILIFSIMIKKKQDLISSANMTFPAVVVYKTKYSHSVSGRVAVAVAAVNISRLSLKLDGVAWSISVP